ncbi:MAG: hypothetical protein GY830_07280 [Bacteroidetes bacterium]|nr:hypothetical protein [Bacteroidota bacterium]
MQLWQFLRNTSTEQATLIIAFSGLIISIFIFVKQYQIEKTKVKIELYKERKVFFNQFHNLYKKYCIYGKELNWDGCDGYQPIEFVNNLLEDAYLISKKDANKLEDILNKYICGKSNTEETFEKCSKECDKFAEKYLRFESNIFLYKGFIYVQSKIKILFR